MTKAVFTRRSGALYPADDEARELISAMKDGKDCMVTVHVARSPRQHRLFFALLGLLVANSDAFVSVDDALRRVKIATGEVETFINPDNGKCYFFPNSVAFESMDGVRFTRLFDRALHVITTRWLAGTDADELRAEVFALVDGPAAIGRRAA